MSNAHSSLILASTSQYRREILAKLAVPFIQVSPDFDEIPLKGEAPVAMAERFAAGKAMAVASDPLYIAPKSSASLATGNGPEPNCYFAATNGSPIPAHFASLVPALYWYWNTKTTP